MGAGYPIEASVGKLDGHDVDNPENCWIRVSGAGRSWPHVSPWLAFRQKLVFGH